MATPDESSDAAAGGPSLLLAPEDTAAFPRVELDPESLVVHHSPRRQEKVPLDALRHLECSAADQVRLSWGRGEVGKAKSVQVTVGSLRAGDLRDAVEAFVQEHAPATQFSIREGNELRLAHPSRETEVFPAGPQLALGRRARGFGRSKLSLLTEAGSFRVRTRDSFLIRPPEGCDLLLGMELRAGLLLRGDGLVLGICRSQDAKTHELRLCDGRVFSWGGEDDSLRGEDGHLGKLTVHRLKLKRPQPLYLVLGLLLADLSLRPPEGLLNRVRDFPQQPVPPEDWQKIGLIAMALSPFPLWAMNLITHLPTVAGSICGQLLIYGLTAWRLRKTSSWQPPPQRMQRATMHPQHRVVRIGGVLLTIWPLLVVGLGWWWLRPPRGVPLATYFYAMGVAGLMLKILRKGAVER